MENEEISRKTWGRQPNHRSLQKRPIHGENEVNNQKRERINTWSSRCLRELTWMREWVRKNENVNACWNGKTFLGFYLPKESKFVFQKWLLFPIRIFLIPFPFPRNNYLNQFLAEINDWVNKIRKVIDSVMVSPFDIWIFPIGSKVWIFPPPLSIGNHAPIFLMLHWHSWLWVF